MSWNFIDDYTGDRFFHFGDSYFDMDQLKMDQHFFTVTPANSDVNIDNIYVHTLNKQCVECPYLFLDKSKVNLTATDQKFRIATKKMEYFPQDHLDSVICDLDPRFGQFGIYNIKVASDGCVVDTLKEPVNIYLPILTVFVSNLFVFGVIALIYILITRYRRKMSPTRNEEDPKPKKQRVVSLDTFRGISIAIMIFANFGNGGYQFVHHAIWNGLHVADLVFPWFMWIMGVCVPISLVSSFKRNVPRWVIMSNILKRSVKLFAIGIFLTGGSNMNYIRLFGVLQRFAVSYFVVGAICVFTMDRDLNVKANSKLKFIDDILKLWKGWIIVLTLLGVHTSIIFLVAEPGCPRGYLGPGGLHKNRSYEKCIGGATGYIDRLLLGTHTYQKPTIYSVYEAKPFDPEGIVGCLTTIFHVFLGVQAGVTLLVFKKHSDRIIRWLGWSVILGIIGGGLCGFSKEDGIIPVNKNLWSLSFVLVTCCFAFFLLTVCYFLIDVRKWWSGKPLLFAGMNAIILYIGHEMTDNHFPVRMYHYEYNADDWRRTHFAALSSDVWAVDFWIVVAFYLYKIDYFFTV